MSSPTPLSVRRRIQDLEAQALAAETALAPPQAEPVPIRTPADVVALLAEQINSVRADHTSDPQDRARTIAGLATVALQAMKAAEMDARVEAVERMLRLRSDSDRQRGNRNGRH